MKKQKTVIIAALAVLTALALTGGMVESMAMPFQGISQNPAPAQQEVNLSVNLDQAKAIAFEKAGVAEAEALDKDYDFEHGIYEIDFEHGGMEYEYKISAATGEIVYEEVKPETKPQSQQPAQPQQKPTEEANRISFEEAKAAAFAKAGIAETDAFDKDYDFEHGIYEIDFEHGGMEYEYKIDASTGEIVYENVKPDDDARKTQTQQPAEQQPSQPQQPAQNKISAEDAKAAAFAAAGVNESEVHDKDFDFEHGRYEVDFEKDGIEYEYVIDAETGAVIYEHTERDGDDDRWDDDDDDDWDDRYDDDDWDD